MWEAGLHVIAKQSILWVRGLRRGKKSLMKRKRLGRVGCVWVSGHLVRHFKEGRFHSIVSKDGIYLNNMIKLELEYFQATSYNLTLKTINLVSRYKQMPCL